MISNTDLAFELHFKMYTMKGSCTELLESVF